MKYDILTVGFPMVEIMRKERNVPFDVPADFTGPYPSADTKSAEDIQGIMHPEIHTTITVQSHPKHQAAGGYFVSI